MIPFDSTEIRWFFEGAMPPRVLERFSSDAASPAAERRGDEYLVSSDEGLGVKLREGHVELKVRRPSRHRIEVGEADGWLEQWTKWSLASPDVPGDGASLSGPWVRVEKARRQARFAWDAGSVRVVQAGRVPRGGAVELTDLELGGVAHWSFAVEAFEHGEEAGRMVRTAARRWLERLALTASVVRSMGYPAWLLAGRSDA